MQKTINGEEVVRISSTQAGIAPSKSGYTMSYSFDDEHWTNWPEPVPANEPLIVNGAIPGMLIKLLGNTDNVEAQL